MRFRCLMAQSAGVKLLSGHVMYLATHSLQGLEREVGMRLFFICASAVAVYADLYAHICMKPHKKSAKCMRISAYMRKTAYMRKNAYAHMKIQLKCATRSDLTLNEVDYGLTDHHFK